LPTSRKIHKYSWSMEKWWSFISYLWWTLSWI